MNFACYLRERDLYAPSPGPLWCLRKLAHLDQLVTVNFNHLTGMRARGFRRFFELQGQSRLFHWANTELKKRYQDAFGREFSVFHAGGATL